MITASNIASLTAAALLGGAASVAGTSYAQSSNSDPAAPQPKTISYELGRDAVYPDILKRLSAQGFDVQDIEYDDGKIEVTGLNSDGRCLEIYFHPASGKELRRKRDDDCDRRGSKATLWSDDLWDDDDFDDRYDD